MLSITSPKGGHRQSISTNEPPDHKPAFGIAELSDTETPLRVVLADDSVHVGARTVETHIGNLFGKLALEETRDDHRRVLAVLAHLGSR